MEGAVALVKSSRPRERGSALVELISTLTVLTTLIGGGLFLIYFCLSKVWISRATYEAVICLASSAPEFFCKKKLVEDVRRALPLGEVLRVDASRRMDSAQASVKIGWRKLGAEDLEILSHRDQRRLPLRSGLRP